MCMKWKFNVKCTLSERSVEVVTSLERQNQILYSCHNGINDSITSSGVAGHLGRDKIYSMLSQVS